MACENLVGVRNIMITFRDCNGGQSVGPRSHQLATEDIPTVMICGQTYESLPGGFVKQGSGSSYIEMEIIRQRDIPLEWYQGCRVEVDIQVEYLNDIVVTGIRGNIVDSEGSDGHSVTMRTDFKEENIDELLPEGSLVPNV